MSTKLIKEVVESDYQKSLESLWDGVSELLEVDEKEVSEFWAMTLYRLILKCGEAKAKVEQYEREAQYTYNDRGEILSFGAYGTK